MNNVKAVPGDFVRYKVAGEYDEFIEGIGYVLEKDFEEDFFYVSVVSGNYEFLPTKGIPSTHVLVWAEMEDSYEVVNLVD